MVGRLNKAMYGLRDAPQVWQREVRRILSDLGFTESVTAPCVYFNSKTGVRLVTHVDDFLCVGPRRELSEFYKELENVLDLKCETLGACQGDGKVGHFLGRVIEWHDWRIAWRGDHKLVQELLEEWGMESSSIVGTPGGREESGKTGMEEGRW